MSDEKTSPGPRTFERMLSDAFEEKYRIVLASRERYVEAWVAETGLHPSQAQLVQRESDGGRTVTITVERRDVDADLIADAPAMLELLRRAVKYAHEDRMVTPRATRLQRCLDEARALLDRHGRG